MSLESAVIPDDEAGAFVTTVFIVDDHDVVREGLSAMLGRSQEFRVVGTASSAEEALEKVAGVDPDVIVLDHRLPGMDGLAFCREAAERRLRGRIIVLSAHLDDRVAEDAILAGARAYVVKDVEADELMYAIRGAARGQVLVDPKVASHIVRWAIRRPWPEMLKPQELVVVRLLAQGRSNREIARTVGRSAGTIKSYLEAIYAKLDAGSRTEAVAVALRRGLL